VVPAALLRIILQSVGRGVRIEPLQGRRQRLKFLNNAGLLAQGVYGQIQDDAQADIVARSSLVGLSGPDSAAIVSPKRRSLRISMDGIYCFLLRSAR
jgi:hypothetical protein